MDDSKLKQVSRLQNLNKNLENDLNKKLFQYLSDIKIKIKNLKKKFQKAQNFTIQDNKEMAVKAERMSNLFKKQTRPVKK